MKKLLLLVIVLSSVCFGSMRVVKSYELEEKNDIFYVIGENKPFTGKFVAENYDGLKEIEASMKNGVFHGKLKTYYDNGQPHIEMYVRNGVTHGKFKEYYKNGKLKRSSYFKNGEVNGITKSYNIFGNLTDKTKIKNGMRIKQEIRYQN